MSVLEDPQIARAARRQKPPGRVERRKARTRAALIAAARALFAARGVEPTTIAEIAEQADVAVGSFYNYFATKEELLAAILKEALGEQLKALQSRQAQVSDPAEVISVAHRHLVHLAAVDRDLAWLLVRLEVPQRIGTTVLRDAAQLDLDVGIAAGRFSVGDPPLALTASGGALLAVMHAVLEGEASADAASAHAEGVLRAFGVAPAEAAEIARRPLPPITVGGQEDER
jgi:AcrR family transcriptional regulator